MKKVQIARIGKWIILIVLGIQNYSSVFAQVDGDTLLRSYPSNQEIYKAIGLTDSVKYASFTFKDETDSTETNTYGIWYWVNVVGTLPPIDFTDPNGLRELTIYGPFGDDYQLAASEVISGTSIPVFTVEYTYGPIPLILTTPELSSDGLYIVKAVPFTKESLLSIESSQPLAEESSNREAKGRPGECISCIDGKMPEAGTYLISAWVSTDQPAGTTVFTGPKITVNTSSGSTDVIPSDVNFVIDGWQLIEGEFEIPIGNLDFQIVLSCSTGACYFDDIRFLPFNSSMKSYVYDIRTKRLTAELDERHYSTIYEYDEEGKLKRIKKETERGIKTIQESASSTRKN